MQHQQHTSKMYSYTGTTREFTGRIALFDIDGTLVRSKSGRRWAQNGEDWIWTVDSIPATLSELWREGWVVALMTNQSQWSKKPDEPKGKIESILTAIETTCGWRPWCFIATHAKDTVYRKPARGLYDALLTALGKTVDAVTHLQMCGDAVGEDDPYLPYRWSDSDKKFAETIRATFKRPMDVLGSNPIPMPITTQEIVLLVGNPGSGKSTTGRRFAEAGYVHIEQDVVGTKAKMLKTVKEALATGKSVVIDGTHGSYKNREEYEKLSKTASKTNPQTPVQMRIIWQVIDGRGYNSRRPARVPEVAYAVYTKHYMDPRGDGVEVELVSW